MKNILIVIVLMLFPVILFSNGGPIDYSELLKTGNVRFVNESGFTIEKEHIDFVIVGNYTYVDVMYKIRNLNTEQNISYAFPIDIMPMDGVIDLERNDREIPSYQVYVNGNEVSYSISDTVEDINYKYPKLYNTKKEITVKGYRFYYISDFSFEANETLELNIKYKMKNQYMSFGTTKSALPSYTERLLYYNVKPSKYWGNGILKEFSYNIDFSDVLAKEGKVNVFPKEGVWDGEIYRFKNVDHDLNLANDIIFSYDISDYLMSSYFDSKRIAQEYITSLKASSTLPREKTWDYDVDNLFDNNFKTVWVEGADGNGIGDYIEIELKDFRVSYIGIINGHNHSEKLYKENSRAKEIKCELFVNTDKGNTRFPDGIITSTIKLLNLDFEKINNNNYSKYTQEIADMGDWSIHVDKIRITILSAYDGDLFEDLCLSELIILGRPIE